MIYIHYISHIPLLKINIVQLLDSHGLSPTKAGLAKDARSQVAVTVTFAMQYIAKK